MNAVNIEYSTAINIGYNQKSDLQLGTIKILVTLFLNISRML